MSTSPLLTDITRPCALLDAVRCQANIERMVDRARMQATRLRPHFKTHQSALVGKWFQDAGVNQGTVSSVSMASYFAKHGWDDLTIAFPLNPREWREINRLADSITLHVTITSPHILDFLQRNPPDNTLGYFIKLDVGTQRTGFSLGDASAVRSAIEKLSRVGNFRFSGFLYHIGHSYSCRSQAEIQLLHDNIRDRVNELRIQFNDLEPFVVSSGDTPTCSVAENWTGIDEMRAGNFVYYDLMQWQIGSCRLQDIAVCLATPVVAIHESRQSIIVYGGGIHLSKDRMSTTDRTIFGMPVLFDSNSLRWQMPDESCHVSGLSQEHGVLQVSRSFIDQVKVGDLVGILPVHSCMMADTMKSLKLTTGEPVEMMTYV